MDIQKFNNRSKRAISVFLISVFLLSINLVLPAGALNDPLTSISSGTAASKISTELQEKMEAASDTELIPVWIFLQSIDQNTIKEKLFEETNLNPAVYEDETQFNKEIYPQIVQQKEAELGYKTVHSPILQSTTKMKDQTTPIDLAVIETMSDYLAEKRAIVRREYTALNNSFIKKYLPNIKRENLIYNSRYTSSIVVELHKSEIEPLTAVDLVESLALMPEAELVPAVNDVLGQVGVYGPGGTGYDDAVGNWYGYSGLGVDIGIIETTRSNAGGRFDSTATQLSGNSRLHFLNLVRPNGTVVPSEISEHATHVTSIIAGQLVPYNNDYYMGVAPLANVYQVPAQDAMDVLYGIAELIDRNVDVINLSLSAYINDTYTIFDREVDRYCAESGVVIVVAAGNRGATTTGEVASPAKALNVISVGNAYTKASQTQVLSSPYAMAEDSSYQEPAYLPNKPDIVAPGSNICCIHGPDGIYSDSGTSFSAPIVTGIIAKMIQSRPALMPHPEMVKALLLLGADASKMSSTNNTLAGGYLREKSGAGMVSEMSPSLSAITLFASNTNTQISQVYLNPGDKIRAVLVYNRRYIEDIGSIDDRDSIYLILKKDSNNSTVSYSCYPQNNVEIIEFVASSSGYYTFSTDVAHLANINLPPTAAFTYHITYAAN